jgi:hypothetical protein
MVEAGTFLGVQAAPEDKAASEQISKCKFVGLGSMHEIATAIARCAEERAWRRCDYFETADIVAGSALLMC